MAKNIDKNPQVETENTELEQTVVETEVAETADPEIKDVESTETDNLSGEDLETDTSTDIPEEYYKELNNVNIPADAIYAPIDQNVDPEYLRYKKFKEIEKQEALAAQKVSKRQDFIHKLNVASKTIPNFQQKVVLNPAFTNEYGGISEFGNEIASVLADTENPIPLLNYLGNEGSNELARLKNLRGFALGKELWRLEEKISQKMAPKKISNAPAPIKPVNNTNSSEIPAVDPNNPKLSYQERKALRKQQKQEKLRR